MTAMKSVMGLLATALIQLSVHAQPLAGKELYPGEQKLYDRALKEGMVISFDTGPTWANWKNMFKGFKARYPGIELVYNDLGSAATVVALDKAKNRPQADTAYYFGASAIDAAKKGLTDTFSPLNGVQIPDVFKDKDGKWFTVHTLNIAFLVNNKLVQEIPHSWADLKKPIYKNAIVYQDPRTTGQGQVLTFAAAYANGGDTDNVIPGIDYLAQLHKQGNILRTVGTTPYAQFIKGEIPIWIGYENDGLKAKLQDGMGEDISVIIPEEASVAAPYAIAKVKGAPHPYAADLWLNYIMSKQGQQTFAEGFVRPVIKDTEIPASVAPYFSAAPQIKPLDLAKAAAQKPVIDKEWQTRVLGQ